MWVLLIHVSSMLLELPSNWPNFVKFLAADSKRFRLVCLHVKKNNQISRWCSSDWNGRLHWISYSSLFFFFLPKSKGTEKGTAARDRLSLAPNRSYLHRNSWHVQLRLRGNPETRIQSSSLLDCPAARTKISMAPRGNNVEKISIALFLWL